jgi:DEAD/DEAH box helicase domain-containing protein
MAQVDGALEAQQRNAAWLEFLMVPSNAEDKAQAELQTASWLSLLPRQIREPGAGFAPVISKANEPVSIIGWWPMLLAKGIPANQRWVAPAAVLLDPSGAADEDALHRAWRRWLQLFNTLQFMPGTLCVTGDGLAARDYDVLDTVVAATPPGQPATQSALNAAWQAVVERSLDALVPGLRQLARLGAMPPEVGLELVDNKGRVSADSELAWVTEKVVVLRPDQADLVDIWGVERWHVVLLDEAVDLVAGIPWATAAAARLGLELNVTEGGAA